MTRAELEELFEKHKKKYIKFDDIPLDQRRSNRPDLHAFILLNELVPGTTDIVSDATHDQIWVDVEPGELAKVVNENQIIDLIRCGMSYDDENDSFYLFT